MKKIILIDTSNLFYRAFFAIPQNFISPKGQIVNAVFGSCSVLLAILKNEQPDFIFFFKDTKEKTFRHNEYDQYKAGRAKIPDELVQQLPIIDDLLASFSLPVFSYPGFEADDLIATAIQKFNAPQKEFLILSTDQDLFALVQENVFIIQNTKGGNFKRIDSKQIKEKFAITPQQIADFKAIAGDSSDNIPGIFKIGKKGAAELLQQFNTLENIKNNFHNVPAKFCKKLENNLEKALKMKKLIKLNSSVPLSLDLAQGSINNISYQKIDSFLKNLGFNALRRRLINIPLFKKDQDQMCFF